MSLDGRDWDAMACRGCGQQPENLAPHSAVAVSRLLQRRCSSLLNHPEDSLLRRGSEPDSWSVMEPVMRVCEVLRAANRRLRDLLGEESLEAAPAPLEAPLAVLASFAQSVSQLTASIGGATAEDWYRYHPDTGGTAGALVWLALHTATHHLEDAELVLDATLSSVPSSGLAAAQARA